MFSGGLERVQQNEIGQRAISIRNLQQDVFVQLGRCSYSVPEHLDQISGGEKPSTVKFKSTGYDNVPVTRPRANTAPSMVLNEVIKKPFVKQRRCKQYPVLFVHFIDHDGLISGY